MKFDYMGWVVAAGIGMWLISTGFQGGATKVGVVDIKKVFDNSDYKKAQSDSLQALIKARSDTLDFVKTYRLFTPEQAGTYKELSSKATLTSAEVAQLEKIKNDVMAADRAFRDLQLKKNPTADDSAKLNEYNVEAQTMAQTSMRWAASYDQEIRDLTDKLQGDTLERVREAIKSVGTKDGYTTLFSTDIAPYGANDATDASLKAMNAKK